MNNILKATALFLFSLSGVIAFPSPAITKRQLFPNNPFFTSATSTTTEGTTTTTATPEYRNCIARCPVTPEYNPVCGSNRQTYNNSNRLRCAVVCGLDVQILFQGTCQPTT